MNSCFATQFNVHVSEQSDPWPHFAPIFLTLVFFFFLSGSIYLEIDAHDPPLEVHFQVDRYVAQQAPQFTFHSVNFMTLNSFLSTRRRGEMHNLSCNQASLSFYDGLQKTSPCFGSLLVYLYSLRANTLFDLISVRRYMRNTSLSCHCALQIMPKIRSNL